MGKPSTAVKELRSKKIYSELRVPRVRQEMKDLMEQRAALSSKMKELASMDPKQQAATRNEGIYISRRIEILRAEMKDLVSGRKTTISKLKETRKTA
jgi:hypothetical protein